MATMRVQKFLSGAGICSRRKGEEYILAGRVRVNGAQITELGTRIDPQTDRVEVDGRRIYPTEEARYILLHKPRGYVSSCRRHRDPIVLDLLDIEERVYPVGRLDKDSSGLLLLTNDGRLHQRLSHPSFDHEKEYDVTVQYPIAQKALHRMAAGLTIMGRVTRPAQVRRLGARRFAIVLQEGRNRQIRRMVRKIGNRVVRLKRTRIAGLMLGKLPEGAWRHLTAEEIDSLLAGG